MTDVISATQCSPAFRRLPACALVLCLAFAPSLGAQRRSAGTMPAHATPAGVRLAEIAAATTLDVAGRNGDWAQVRLEGWISGRSIRTDRREGFDVLVSAPGGENLRAAPNGALVARLQSGMRLERVETRGAWVHVRRAVWIASKTAAAPPKSAPAYQSMAARPPTPQRAGPAPARARADSLPAVAGTSGDRVEAARGTPLFLIPEGGQLGSLETGASARVLARSGEWVRVQTEGWVRDADLRPAAGAALAGVSAAEVRANPDRYVGQLVDWRLQVVSMQVADELRPEMPNGSPYLLTRGPLPEPGFVYVMTTREQLARFRELGPLAEVMLRVRIRASRTKYLATPVVELESLVESAPPGR